MVGEEFLDTCGEVVIVDDEDAAACVGVPVLRVSGDTANGRQRLGNAMNPSALRVPSRGMYGAPSPPYGKFPNELMLSYGNMLYSG